MFRLGLKRAKFCSNYCVRSSSKEADCRCPQTHLQVQLHSVPLLYIEFANFNVSGFGMSDPLHKTHNREVTEATQLLFMTVIPEFVDKAQKNGLNVSAMDGNLIKEIHKEGKNANHQRRKINRPIDRNKRAPLRPRSKVVYGQCSPLTMLG